MTPNYYSNKQILGKLCLRSKYEEYSQDFSRRPPSTKHMNLPR